MCFRCADCVVNKLDELASGDYGELLRSAVRWREAMNLGLAVRLDDVPADELAALELLEQIYPRNGRNKSNPTDDST